MKVKILIVEDQFIEANHIRLILKKAGYALCSLASSVAEALTIIDNEKPDIILLDIYLQGSLTGIDLALQLMDKGIAYVFLSANSEKSILERAKQTKPYGFLVKPFREKDVLVMLDIAWYLHQQKQESVVGKALMHQGNQVKKLTNSIIGGSEVMQALLHNIEIIGSSDISALILGESGTGKEMVAHQIHQLSARRLKPLITVNCAALPASLIESELFGHERGAFTGAIEKRVGKFELANEGTIFLDEIGELPLDLQVKFLRVLQEKEIEPIGGKKKKINVRVIAATNRNLENEMAIGNFRMDLYYRLNVFPIALPALRERKEDIPLLAAHFLSLFSQRENKTFTGFADHVMKEMLAYNWPGNVRELENMMARSVLLNTGKIIDHLELPKDEKKEELLAANEPVKSMMDNEKEHILMALITCNWQLYGRGGAAELLKINASTLSSRMKKHGIKKQSSPRFNS